MIIDGLFSEFAALHFLSLFYFIAFACNSYVYGLNNSSVKHAAAQNEELFIYLYQNTGLNLLFPETGEILYFRDEGTDANQKGV